MYEGVKKSESTGSISICVADVALGIPVCANNEAGKVNVQLILSVLASVHTCPEDCVGITLFAKGHQIGPVAIPPTRRVGHCGRNSAFAAVPVRVYNGCKSRKQIPRSHL